MLFYPLLALVLIIVALAVGTWTIHLVARRLEAANNTANRCVLAAAAALLAAVAIGIGLVFLSPAPYWWAAVGLHVLILTGLVSWLLQTTPLRGLGIAAMSDGASLAVIGLILFALANAGPAPDKIHALFSASGANQQAQQLTIEEAVVAVCDCGQDRQCLQQNYAEVIVLAAELESDLSSSASVQLEMARRCVTLGKQGALKVSPTAAGGPPAGAPSNSSSTPSNGAIPSTPSPASTAAPTTNGSTTETKPETKAAPGDNMRDMLYGEQPSIVGRRGQVTWVYKPVPISQVNRYQHQRVRILRNDSGKMVEGTMVGSGSNDRYSYVAISTRRYRGDFEIQIPTYAISKIEVRLKGE